MVRALLILSSGGVFTLDSMKRLAGVGDTLAMEFLNQLINDGIVEVVGGNYRVKVSIPALIKYLLNRGHAIDLEGASRYISWDAFEGLISLILNEWGFRVFNRLRVPVGGSRYEFDVVAHRRPLVLLIEAKRHKYVGGRLSSIVNRHIMKVEGVAREPEVLMSRIGVDWGEAVLVPVVITWHRANTQFMSGVPIVSIYQLNSFISALDSLMGSIMVIRVSWHRIK